MGSCDATSLMEDGTQKPLQNVSKGEFGRPWRKVVGKGAMVQVRNLFWPAMWARGGQGGLPCSFQDRTSALGSHCMVQLLPSLELLRGANTLDWRVCDCTALLGPLATVAVLGGGHPAHPNPTRALQFKTREMLSLATQLQDGSFFPPGGLNSCLMTITATRTNTVIPPLTPLWLVRSC